MVVIFFILKLLVAIIGLAALVAVIITLCPSHLSDFNYRKNNSDPDYRYLVLGLAYIGWIAICSGGIYLFLWWIPSDWGNLEEDAWISTRKSLSSFLGFALGMFVVQQLYAAMENWGRVKMYQEELEDIKKTKNTQLSIKDHAV